MTQTLLSPQQLEDRKLRIGSSEVPTVMGAKPGLHQLWLEKTGQSERTFTGNSYTEWGNRLESPVADAYGEKMSEWFPNVILSEPGTLVHPAVPWAQATPDRLVHPHGDTLECWGLEVKTTSRSDGWGPDGSTMIPEWVEWQVRWQMWVANMDRWDVAVLIGGSDFRVYTIVREASLENLMVERVSRFYLENVKMVIPPVEVEADPWQDMDAPDTVVRDALPTEADTLTALAVCKGQIAALEERRDMLEGTLKRTIGGSLGLRSSDWVAKWTPVKGRASVDWKHVSESLGVLLDSVVVSDIVKANTSVGRGYRRLTVTSNRKGAEHAVSEQAPATLDGDLP